MPQKFATLGNQLFKLQFACGFGIILFASQEEKFIRAGYASSGLLALWAVISFVLVSIHSDFVLQHIAALASRTLTCLFLFSTLFRFELYHIGLFIPAAINFATITVYRPDRRALIAIGGAITGARQVPLLPAPATHPYA